MGEQVFQVDNYSSKYDLFERYAIDTFLKTIPDTAKSSILELMEYYFINTIVYFARHEIRDMMPYLTENESNYDIDSPEPTYISEYIGIVGNLFLAGYMTSYATGTTIINKRIILQICLTMEIPNTKLGYILEITFFIKKGSIELTKKTTIIRTGLPPSTLLPLGISLKTGVGKI